MGDECPLTDWPCNVMTVYTTHPHLVSDYYYYDTIRSDAVSHMITAVVLYFFLRAAVAVNHNIYLNS